jgi:hypothetical protein
MRVSVRPPIVSAKGAQDTRVVAAGPPEKFPPIPPSIPDPAGFFGAQNSSKTQVSTVIVDGRRVDARTLLPKKLQALDVYGFPAKGVPRDAVCFDAAAWIARPATAPRLTDGMGLQYIQRHLNRLGADEKPRPNDVGLMMWSDGKGYEAPFHAFVQVSPDLVWSKDGAGAGNPLFLRPWSELQKQWTPQNGMKLVVAYYRDPSGR